MIIKPSNATRGASNILPYLPNPSSQVSAACFHMTAYPLQFTLFSAVTSAQVLSAQSPVIQVLGRNLHAVAVTGTFSASVLIEATLDGVNWATLATFTTPQVTQFTGLYQDIRVTIPTYVSGTITVTAITQRT